MPKSNRNILQIPNYDTTDFGCFRIEKLHDPQNHWHLREPKAPNSTIWESIRSLAGSSTMSAGFMRYDSGRHLCLPVARTVGESECLALFTDVPTTGRSAAA
jgi:hypothetical protein